MADTTRTAEALSALTEGIAALCSTAAWKQYLDAARLFHDYSFANTVLIARQAPWASRVAGFHTWRRLGRFVRKGDRAIWILAPVTGRRGDSDTADDEQDQKRRTVVGFRAVSVFDISQTDGEPLPEIATRLVGDDAVDAFQHLVQVAGAIGYTVAIEELPGERNRDTTFAARSIRVRRDLAVAHMVKTLCHELAHALLHDGFDGPRELAECEAESVAYSCAPGSASTARSTRSGTWRAGRPARTRRSRPSRPQGTASSRPRTRSSTRSSTLWRLDMRFHRPASIAIAQTARRHTPPGGFEDVRAAPTARRRTRANQRPAHQ